MEPMPTIDPGSQEVDKTPLSTKETQGHQEPKRQLDYLQPTAEKDLLTTSSPPRKFALGNKLWADVCEEAPTTPLLDPPPAKIVVPPTKSQPVASIIDPLIEHLQSWHLSTNFNMVLDKLHTGHSEELEAKLYIDYEMEEELVANILQNLMDSIMLIYFT